MFPYRTAALAFALPALACQSVRPAEEARWIIDVNPTASIEWDSDIDGYDLHDVRAVMRLDDGRIAVVDGGSAEIRYFDGNGAFLGRVGGEGTFHRLKEAIRGSGDTIVVRTLDPAVVHVEGGTGAIISRVPLNPEWSGAGWLSPDGSLLIASYTPPDERVEGEQFTATMARFDPATGILDTLGVLPAGEGPYSYGRFRCILTVAQAPGRFYAGQGCDDSITVQGLDGAPLGIRRSGLVRNDVPREIIDEAAALRRPIDLPARYPRFFRLLSDRAGNLWVMAYPQLRASTGWRNPAAYLGVEKGADWVVLDPAGHRIALVRTPPGLHVQEIGDDYVIGVVREDVNVESVRTYALHRHP